MRLTVCLAGFMFLLPATPSFGEVISADEVVSDELIETSDNYDKQDQWNRWVCEAGSRRSWRTFFGASWYFRAGSGEGQDAMAVAQKIAERNCEFRTGGYCYSTRNDCNVRRY